jgi:uncharacterized integral membrane protein
MLTIALVLLLVIGIAVFSVQNAVPVTISFFFWRFEASLAIVIFLSAVTGLIMGMIIGILFRKKPSDKKEVN